MFRLTCVASVPIARGPVVLCTPYPSTDGVFTGDGEKVIVRLDKQTLKETWRRRTKLQVRSGHDGIVLLAYYDEMQAWKDSGEIAWRRKTTQNYSRRDDRLFFVEPRLEIVDVATGRVIEAMDCPEGSPDLIMDEILIVTDPFNIDPVRAFHLRERRVLWATNLAADLRTRHGLEESGPVMAMAAGGEGRCVLATGRHLAGMSVSNAEVLWTTRLYLPYFGVQVTGGRIYAWTTAPRTTTTRTTFALESGQVSRERPQPAIGENRFVIVDEMTGEIVVDRPLARYGAPFEGFQEPQRGTLCKHHIVFTTRSGLIALFRLSDGELVWYHEHEDQLFYPVLDGNRLYVACANGTIMVFEVEGGEL